MMGKEEEEKVFLELWLSGVSAALSPPPLRVERRRLDSRLRPGAYTQKQTLSER